MTRGVLMTVCNHNCTVLVVVFSQPAPDDYASLREFLFTFNQRFEHRRRAKRRVIRRGNLQRRTSLRVTPRARRAVLSRKRTKARKRDFITLLHARAHGIERRGQHASDQGFALARLARHSFDERLLIQPRRRGGVRSVARAPKVSQRTIESQRPTSRCVAIRIDATARALRRARRRRAKNTPHRMRAPPRPARGDSRVVGGVIHRFIFPRISRRASHLDAARVARIAPLANMTTRGANG